MVEKLSALSEYIESLAAENDVLRGRLAECAPHEETTSVCIESASAEDLSDVLEVENRAFAGDPDIEILVRDLLGDPTAQPLVSLLAREAGRPIGHIMFTAVHINGSEREVRASILAPLAVVPERQRQGIGGRLIERGLGMLDASGVELVFVLGHPAYYPQFGFEPAGALGLAAPFPIPDDHADAWMVRTLRHGVLDGAHGTVVCAESMNKAQYWRE
ncbi:MAG: GNAT family N-acetyltransferase [Actinobacteria bacterium HGW-Actinobacteria-1]|nr:MAG: GNAT family N-acetyltransferase [Actinobacteria bacterium HGW-Actinobacteria-1]